MPFQLSEKLRCALTSFLEQNYADTWEEKDSAELEFYSFQPERCAPRRASCCESLDRLDEDLTVVSKALTLEEALKAEDMGFSEALLKLIDECGKKDAEVYKKANLSKQHFSKIRNNPNYKPTKPTAIALALALELDLEQTKEFIGRAGYALTNSSKFDLIIQFFIQQKNYDIAEINMALYEFDQVLLGGAG